VSSDVAAAMKFLEEVMTITEGRGYSSKQVFSVDGTGLFWKRMPSQTFISRESTRLQSI
jgi:hypothetical protein